jgi:hypothetical protein
MNETHAVQPSIRPTFLAKAGMANVTVVSQYRAVTIAALVQRMLADK